MQSAVYYQPDESPALELAAEEFVFPLTVEQGGEKYIALFHMGPYQPRELIDFLDKSAKEFRSSGRARVIVEASADPGYSDLFDRHFIRLSGIEGEPSVEEQKKWLAAHDLLKRRVIQEGYGGGEILEAENGSIPRRGLRLADITSNRIGMGLTLWSTEQSRAEPIIVTHMLRPETLDDQRRYTLATGRLETHTRKGTWKVLVDHAAVCALYDAMVEEVTSCVVNGLACKAENKAVWAGLIPAWHKVAVMLEVFTGGSIKNA